MGGGSSGRFGNTQGGSGKTGSFTNDTPHQPTPGEWRVINDLVKKGKTIEMIPRSTTSGEGTPDMKVNGVRTEIKTLENANTNTGMKRAKYGFNKQGAAVVIVDARGSGLSKLQARELINRLKGQYTNGRLPGRIEVWIDGGIIRYP
ncbi:MAG: hypothetical protein FWE29_04950 [Defluviitaleaceae bacterium]|nr:hypothetical protein [Defluviitaleaceae bacterium]